jgi:hypothetical protein
VAYAFLPDGEDPSRPADLSKALGITKATVYNLTSSMRAKLEKFDDLEEVFKRYWPLVADVNPQRKESAPCFETGGGPRSIVQSYLETLNC